MVAAFPVAKLGFLLVKQVSKPIAKQIAARAKNSPFFRDWICIPTANLFHWYEIQLKLRMLNVGTRATKVPKLNEAKAIEQGSEILSEIVILSIAASILIYEYNRSSDKEDEKVESLRLDRLALKNRLTELELKVERQTIQIKALSNTALELKTDIYNHSLRRRLMERKPELPTELSDEEMNKPIVVPVEEVPYVFPEVDNEEKKTSENVPTQEKSKIHHLVRPPPCASKESPSEPSVADDEKTKEAVSEAKIYDEKNIQLDDVSRKGVITEAIAIYEEGFKGIEETKSCNELKDKDSETPFQNKVKLVKPGLVTGGVEYFMDLGKL